ncbi:PLP-dependent cysteine synthase family protein [Streptomyces sp. MUM 178J]|uniref:PLP-dependent cysteine synthase family protein n=1 Tax=Streptomyces sp. MUM 178J TaxID=2791991 RepID=UPI001F043767|nr:cysteine synthase family protein [Streptomyces sp. MUM 178J]WRQ80795.1 cysteine synthase family protein [Streptomyces sp. MUM 178J]
MTESITVAAAAPPPAPIGDTPMRPVRVPVGDRSVRIWLKLEAENPFGSIKARTAEALLAALEMTGALRPGMRVVESTSGNLGVALAGLCAQRGYDCTLVVEPSTPRASVERMAAFGADVVTVREVPGGRTLGARLQAVQEILATDADAVWTNQYASPANPGVHEWQTASELVKAGPDGRFDAVAVAVSTGGTLAGIARYFRSNLPDTRIVAVDAVGSSALGGEPADRPFKLMGFGSGQLSGFLEPGYWDHAVLLRDAAAAAACVRVFRRTGVSLGGSGGAAVLASVIQARRDPSLREIASVCPDSGEKYAHLYGTPAAAEPDPDPEVREALSLLNHMYDEEKAP